MLTFFVKKNRLMGTKPADSANVSRQKESVSIIHVLVLPNNLYVRDISNLLKRKEKQWMIC